VRLQAASFLLAQCSRVSTPRLRRLRSRPLSCSRFLRRYRPTCAKVAQEPALPLFSSGEIQRQSQLESGQLPKSLPEVKMIDCTETASNLTQTVVIRLQLSVSGTSDECRRLCAAEYPMNSSSADFSTILDRILDTAADNLRITSVERFVFRRTTVRRSISVMTQQRNYRPPLPHVRSSPETRHRRRSATLVRRPTRDSERAAGFQPIPADVGRTARHRTLARPAARSTCSAYSTSDLISREVRVSHLAASGVIS
jgi:hypothetical protein